MRVRPLQAGGQEGLLGSGVVAGQGAGLVGLQGADHRGGPLVGVGDLFDRVQVEGAPGGRLNLPSAAGVLDVGGLAVGASRADGDLAVGDAGDHVAQFGGAGNQALGVFFAGDRVGGLHGRYPFLAGVFLACIYSHTFGGLSSRFFLVLQRFLEIIISNPGPYDCLGPRVFLGPRRVNCLGLLDGVVGVAARLVVFGEPGPGFPLGVEGSARAVASVAGEFDDLAGPVLPGDGGLALGGGLLAAEEGGGQGAFEAPRGDLVEVGVVAVAGFQGGDGGEEGGGGLLEDHGEVGFGDRVHGCCPLGGCGWCVPCMYIQPYQWGYIQSFSPDIAPLSRDSYLSWRTR